MARIKLLTASRNTVELELIRWFLKDLNCLMISVKTGIDAVEAMKHEQDIDLVLMDISLEGPDGRDLSSAIKTINPYIPVIGITAYPVNYVREQHGGRGVDYWLMKPFGREVVMSVMIAALLRRA